MKGKKPESPNQDSFSIHVREGEFALYGVYDGHGPSGHNVSDFVRQTLSQLFLDHSQRANDPKSALLFAFTECQKMVEKLNDDKQMDAEMSGTTCTVAYWDMRKDMLWVAHVGDSRAVIGTRPKDSGALEAKDLTIDHKPDLEKEKKRITSANPPGRVIFDGFYNHRVFAQGALYPGLNMSRAIGDVLGHREAGLTAEPDIWEGDLKKFRDKEEAILLLCTDGVWEFISSKQALKVCFDTCDDCRKSKADIKAQQKAMEVLARASFDAWMKDSDNEISDDITGICVAFGEK
jgi:serine/threonine protein phosphatase PrpC